MVTRTPASAPWPPPVRIRHRGRRTGLDRRCLPRVPAGDRPGSIFHARSRQVSPTASSSHAIAEPIRRCRSGPWATRQALCFALRIDRCPSNANVIADLTLSRSIGIRSGAFRPVSFAKVEAGLSRRCFRQLWPLATTDDRHATIGRGSTVGLCRLPVTRLSFQLLRPTPLKSVHDVARQVRFSHVDDPCEVDRPR
jgi:hypothetical protein